VTSESLSMELFRSRPPKLSGRGDSLGGPTVLSAEIVQIFVVIYITGAQL